MPALVSVLALGLGPGAALPLDFELEPLPLADYHLDDLGVADVDGDGRLDVYTTNHNAAQRVAYGRGDGRFSPVDFETLGMVQNPTYPGLPDSRWRPASPGEGLHVYSLRGRLFLRRLGLAGVGAIRGSLYMYEEQSVSARGFTYSIECGGDPVYPCRLDFESTGDGHLKVGGSIYQNPRRLTVDTALAPERIFVGGRAVPATQTDFKLRLMDRHGIAWSDVDGDGRLDAYISSGGYRGLLEQIRAFHPEIDYNNELFCQGEAGFRACIDGTGLFKEGDRGRRVAWVDFDGDGRLDLYVDNRETANRLFRRRADGRFVDRAGARGLDAVDSGPFVWFDADNDGDADLLTVEGQEIVLQRRVDRAYRREVVGPYRGGEKTWSYGKFSLSDMDEDGYLEALLASPVGSSLVDNDGGVLSERPAEAVGLPPASYALDFVDVDADGHVEVHAFTRACDGDGIYRRTAGAAFERTALMPELRARYCSTVRSAWFDADNDGFPDLALVRKTRSVSREFWKSHLLRNRGNENHWLQIELEGPPGNREALGTRVRLTAGGRARVAQTGQSEGSRYSQGHYRLYFGLGQAATAERIRVFWPDGRETVLRGVAADRILRIGHPLAASAEAPAGGDAPVAAAP
jgi:hypothetical protein